MKQILSLPFYISYGSKGLNNPLKGTLPSSRLSVFECISRWTWNLSTSTWGLKQGRWVVHAEMYVIWTNNFSYIWTSLLKVLVLMKFCPWRAFVYMITWSLLPRCKGQVENFLHFPDEVKRLDGLTKVLWLACGLSWPNLRPLAQSRHWTKSVLLACYTGGDWASEEPWDASPDRQFRDWGGRGRGGAGSVEFKGKCFKGLRRKRAEGQHQVCTAGWTQGPVSCPWRLKVTQDVDRYVQKPFTWSSVFGLGT